MSDDLSVREDELHAYADGHLPQDRVEAVRTWLGEHPDDARDVMGWQSMNAQIREVVGEPDGSLPRRLQPRALLHERRSRTRRVLAASIVMFLVGGAAGWLVHDSLPSEPQPSVELADEGIGAYKVYSVESRHPVEVPAQDRQHLQAWLSKRLDHSLTIPDLSAAGYQLVGGRLLANFAEPRAMFMYEAADRTRLTIYAGRNPLSREAGFRFHRSGEVGAICWLEPDMGYAVVGKADEPALLRVARLVDQQM